jgi:ABC-2 type transport system ATP-binding protein
MQPGNAPILMEHASRKFDEVVAVDDVTLSVQAGTIVGLIGPSGSGKTTVVKLLTGLSAPTGGRVQVLGHDPSHFPRRVRERIGYMPQQFVLYPDLTAVENANFVGSLFGLLWRKRSRRVRETLQMVELWDARNRRAGSLSGGMQRRLALACTLVHEPAVIFVDEPTAGLDPVLRETVWTEFRRLRDAGRTLFVTTQYVGESEYCDVVAMLVEGRVIALGAPQALRHAAIGGEAIVIETDRPFDGGSLPAIPGVTGVSQLGLRQIMITAEDVGEATPRILDSFNGLPVVVVSSREYNPSFDEVFRVLLERDQATRPSVADAA